MIWNDGDISDPEFGLSHLDRGRFSTFAESFARVRNPERKVKLGNRGSFRNRELARAAGRVAARTRWNKYRSALTTGIVGMIGSGLEDR